MTTREDQIESEVITPVIDAEVIEDDAETPVQARTADAATVRPEDRAVTRGAAEREKKKAVRLYLVLPFIFLTVSLMGGLRLSAVDGAFVFVAPALVCLIFAVLLMVLFFRGGLISLAGWFSDEISTLHEAANAAVLVSLFAATTQVFNSVIPETGLPFWVVTFCFAWSLWNNLFAEFDNRRLLKSVGALFAFAFLAKYLLLAGMTAPANEGGWLRSLIENPAKETVTWLLDLPRYSAGTGYIQFFCLLLYFGGLYMMPKNAQ